MNVTLGQRAADKARMMNLLRCISDHPLPLNSRMIRNYEPDGTSCPQTNPDKLPGQIRQREILRNPL